MELPEKITHKTVLSVHMVTVVCGLVVWAIRLSDRVEAHEQRLLDVEANQKIYSKQYSSIRMEIYRIEEHFGIKHPREKEYESDDK